MRLPSLLEGEQRREKRLRRSASVSADVPNNQICTKWTEKSVADLGSHTLTLAKLRRCSGGWP